MITRADILETIRREADARRIAPSTLCLRALSDSQVYRRLSRGGTITVSSVERLQDWLDANPVTEAAQ